MTTSTTRHQARAVLPVHDRFRRHVDTSGDCWLWTGSKDGHGYGQFRPTQEKLVPAHRWAYAEEHGAIPVGLELDHLCRTPLCVRPSHLEAVTHLENVRRGRAGEVNGGRQRAKTHCPKGHEYTPENTLLWTNDHTSRICRECHKAWRKKYYWAKKEAAAR